jgi:hypothetical protein
MLVFGVIVSLLKYLLVNFVHCVATGTVNPFCIGTIDLKPAPRCHYETLGILYASLGNESQMHFWINL